MKHTVLVVEDEDDLRESMRDLLEGSGYKVVTAADGQEALDALNGVELPCVVLLDLMMPGMNGWDFYEQMQKRPKLTGVPVIVQSSAPSRAPTGVTRVIKKPVEPERLISIVREYCADA